MENNNTNEDKKVSSIQEKENQNEKPEEDSKTQIIEDNKLNEKESVKKEEILVQENLRKLSSSNANEIPKKKNKKKSVKQVIKKKSTSNINPFLQVDIENKNTKRIIKREINKYSVRSSYLLHYKNTISDLKEPNQNKSVFSKISEIMYQKTMEENFPKKKEKDIQKDKEEKYDKFTEESYLISHANKQNKENQKIIDEFLERKKKEEIIDKMGIDSDKEKENDLEPLQDNKRNYIITDRNTNFKLKRDFNEFLENQKNKEEKHKAHLKNNEKMHYDKVNSNVFDKPILNEESIKIANKGKRNGNIAIHQRLYDEYNELKEKKEKSEKEKMNINKREDKKASNVNIKKNVERLYKEYEAKKKRINENEMKKDKELKNKASNCSLSKTSNQIIFKRFKRILTNSINIVMNKNLEETFEINFHDFIKLLFLINFTTKNYYELIIQTENNNEKEIINQSIKLYPNSKQNRVIFKKNRFELDRKYKLLVDAWKIVTKRKEFKSDITGESQRLLIFIISVFGIYDGNNNNDLINKEFSFLINDENDNSKYLNLSKQIYKYFNIFKNNAINGLLFRENENKRKQELQKETEKFFTFCPKLAKSSKNYISASNSPNHKKLSVEKNYKDYKKNKELKLKEQEKLQEQVEKEKCPFFPSCTKNKLEHDISKISNRLFNTGLKHLKLSNSTQNNFSIKEQMYRALTENNQKTNNNFEKMFNKNPLESDLDVKKKMLVLEKSRNQKALQKLILKKGYKPKETLDDKNMYNENEKNNIIKRFALENESSNIFKNTFDKYENIEKNDSIRRNRAKYEFIIYVDRKPQKLIIYQDDDINCKVKEFSNLNKLNFEDKRKILKVINQKINNSSILYIN